MHDGSFPIVLTSLLRIDGFSSRFAEKFEEDIGGKDDDEDDEDDETPMGFDDIDADKNAVKAIKKQLNKTLVENREELSTLRFQLKELPHALHYVPSYILSSTVAMFLIKAFPTSVAICVWIAMRGSSAITALALMAALISSGLGASVISKAMYKWHPALLIYGLQEFVQLVSMWLFFGTVVQQEYESDVATACGFFAVVSSILFFPLQMLIAKWFLNEYKVTKKKCKTGTTAHEDLTPPSNPQLLQWPAALATFSERLIPDEMNPYQNVPVSSLPHCSRPYACIDVNYSL